MKPSDWDAYSKVTEHLAVARWGSYWRVVDIETGSEIGPAFGTKWEAREYADYRQNTTYASTHGITESELRVLDGNR